MPVDKTVLVVDDNPTVTKFVVSVLRPLGYKVDAASDGLQALKRVAAAPVDLILLDLVMPKMNGLHFCKAMEQKGLAAGVPVILLTSARERVAQGVLETTTAADVLPKPVKAQQLRDMVERYLPLEEHPGEEDPYVGMPLDFDLEPEHTSDDIAVSSHAELIGLLRAKMDNAMATGLAQKLDEIVAADSRDEVLGLITEVLAAAVNEKLVEQVIKLVRSTTMDSEDSL
jgi:CheY-like chemotaxis protein